MLNLLAAKTLASMCPPDVRLWDPPVPSCLWEAEVYAAAMATALRKAISAQVCTLDL